MTQVRRRAVFASVIALVIALLGGGSIAREQGALRLRRAPTHVTETPRQDVGRAPQPPVSYDDGPAPPVELALGSAAPDPSEAVIKTAPAHFEGDAPRLVAPPAALARGSLSSQSAGGGTWAVVIGINDYPGTENDLSAAVNDANDMVQALGSYGVSGDHVLLLRDGQVTSRTMLDAVGWLAAHAGSDAVAGFFYAGHVRKTSAGNEEIVTSDGSSVSDRELAGALSHVAASRSWVAIAACYGGGFTEVLRPGRVLTAAAGANDLAYENSAMGRSYMVEYMVRQAMVEGRASDTVQSAFHYAVDHLSQDHPGREPVQIDDGDGALDLRPPNATRRSPPDSSDPQPEPQREPEQGSEPPPSDGSGNNQHCNNRVLFRHCNSG